MARGGPRSGEQLKEQTQPGAVREVVASFPRLEQSQLVNLLAGAPVGGAGGDPAPSLVESHLWVVLEAAESRESETLPLDDLFQEGTTALVTFVHGLDPGSPLSPAEFLRRVRQAVDQVMDALVEDEEAARLEDLRWAADAERLFNADAELRLGSGVEPSDVELAAHLNWPVERVSQLRRAIDEARSQHDAGLIQILEEIED